MFVFLCLTCTIVVLAHYVSGPLFMPGAQKRASNPMKLDLKAVVLQIPGLYLQAAVNSHVGARNRIWKTNQCS